MSEYLWEGSDWNFDKIYKTWEAIEEIGVKELGYNLYPNSFEIITSEQMLDAYTSIGMPIGYNHWSFGKQFIQEEKSYQRGRSGLAYELVLNTNPCINVLMESNTMTLQALVMAHAGIGHNAYFKNNYLFKQWTDAEGIIDYLLFAKNYIAECETREGEKEVELFLDSCHALKDHGVNKYLRPAKLSMVKEKERQKEREAYLQTQVSEYYKVLPTSKSEWKKLEKENFPSSPEENILYFCEKYAPNLKPWQREILRIVRKIAQYFYPQTMTQIGNEGFASYTHYTIMNRLHEKGLTSQGAHLEFLESHSGVLWQHDLSVRINPYKFGFEILSDIERICMNPTEEDKYWFPNLPGQKPLDVIKDVVENFRDESLILQYLSPHLIRKMRLFTVKDVKEDSKYFHVTNIHNELGYQNIREIFAAQKDREVYVPRLEIFSVSKKDQTLHIRYCPYKEKKLKADPNMVRHLSRIWGDCPVTIHNLDGSTIMSKN